jgi:hypothetical protein
MSRQLIHLTTREIRQRLEEYYAPEGLPEKYEHAVRVLEDAERVSPPCAAKVAAGWAVFDQVLQPWLERPKMRWAPKI